MNTTKEFYKNSLIEILNNAKEADKETLNNYATALYNYSKADSEGKYEERYTIKAVVGNEVKERTSYSLEAADDAAEIMASMLNTSVIITDTKLNAMVSAYLGNELDYDMYELDFTFQVETGLALLLK